jgi:hypothetical protein
VHQVVGFAKVVTEVQTERLNSECVQGCQVHFVENLLSLVQPLPQPTLVESSVSNLLQKVAFPLKLHPKDVFVQPFVSPCTQIFSGNLRTEVIVVVAAAEFVAEDVAVVVAAHCHASCSDDETSDLENQCCGQSQCFRQLAPFVEVQKGETEHLETQKDELPLMK